MLVQAADYLNEKAALHQASYELGLLAFPVCPESISEACAQERAVSSPPPVSTSGSPHALQVSASLLHTYELLQEL